ncbi:hypothetical protein KCU62_g6859, partial [Aureobasidium sp. EXF-3399]
MSVCLHVFSWIHTVRLHNKLEVQVVRTGFAEEVLLLYLTPRKRVWMKLVLDVEENVSSCVSLHIAVLHGWTVSVESFQRKKFFADGIYPTGATLEVTAPHLYIPMTVPIIGKNWRILTRPFVDKPIVAGISQACKKFEEREVCHRLSPFASSLSCIVLSHSLPTRISESLLPTHAHCLPGVRFDRLKKLHQGARRQNKLDNGRRLGVQSLPQATSQFGAGRSSHKNRAMLQPHAPGTRSSKRGRSVRSSDSQFIASVIREQEVDSRFPLNQTKFLINGKLYPYSEVARRIRRAKQPVTHWSDEFEKAPAQPDHVQIVSSPTSDMSEYNLMSPTGHIKSCPREHQPERRSSVSGIQARWAELMERSIQNCFLDLVTSEENATISPTLSYPDEQLVPAKFYFNIFKYFRGAHDNGQFVRNEVGDLVSHASAKSSANVKNFYKCCITAIDLIERGYPTQGFALVSEALWLIEELLEQRDPKLIDTICDVSVILLTKGWDQVYDILNARICGMVEISALRKGEESHPWSQIFACWRKLPTSQALEFMRRGWRCGYDQFEGISSGLAWEGLNMSSTSSHSLRMGDHTARLHQEIMSAWFSVPDPSALSSMRQQFACGNVLFDEKNYREALGTMESIVSRCATAREKGDQMWVAMEIEALEVAARSSYAISTKPGKLNDVAPAIALLETAILRSESVWGTGSATTIALQHTLWLWLLDDDQHDEADHLRKLMDAVVIKSEPEPCDSPQIGYSWATV